MLARKRKIEHGLTIYLDGKPMQAEQGEPLAIALLAEGVRTLARSPKLHRPRGPWCLRGGCDGCLARVDGLPDQMTCLLAAKGGEHIETQNVVGSREADLLRVTDWFFPKGFDHHHFMAGVPGLSDSMLNFARKLGGLGRLPADVKAPAPVERIEMDVLVVGMGPSGRVAASTLAEGGVSVWAVDDAIEPGGTVLALAPSDRARVLAHPTHNAHALWQTTAAGVYEREVLVVSHDKTRIMVPRVIVFATGAHDVPLSIPGNDLPGVMAARAVCRLWEHGVRPTGPVVVVGSGYWAERLTKVLGGNLAVHASVDDVLEIYGTSRVKHVSVNGAVRRVKYDADIVAVGAGGAAVFELAAQAGADVHFDAAKGYVIACDEHGRAGDYLWAVGECAGRAFDLDALIDAGARVARNVMGLLRGSRLA